MSAIQAADAAAAHLGRAGADCHQTNATQFHPIDRVTLEVAKRRHGVDDTALARVFEIAEAALYPRMEYGARAAGYPNDPISAIDHAEAVHLMGAGGYEVLCRTTGVEPGPWETITPGT